MVTERYNADVRIRYMRVLELKLKLAWISLEKEYKEDDKKDAVIIELEEYQNPEQKVFKPFKVKEQLLEIISDIKGIVNDLPGDSHREQVLHL
jgi:adenylate kinase family enzyme